MITSTTFERSRAFQRFNLHLLKWKNSPPSIFFRKPIFLVFVLFAGISISNSVNAQDAALEPAIQEASEAVVSVTGYMRTENTDSEFRQYAESSGFFFDETGFLITTYFDYVDSQNRRLCENFEVKQFDGRIINARMFAADPALNLAILKVIEGGRKFPRLDISNPPEAVPGEAVWAIAGQKPNDLPVYFTGQLKAEEKTTIYEDGFSDLLLDTYMELPAHAYGGPLLNRQGEVIGMNTLHSYKTTNIKKGETGEEHAVPIRSIAIINKVLMTNPTFEQKWLGFSTRFLTIDEVMPVKQLLKRRQGVFIDYVWKEGPAIKTDVRSGDILLKLNGHRLKTPNQVNRLLFEAANDAQAQLTIFREGAVLNKSIQVEKRPQWAAP